MGAGDELKIGVLGSGGRGGLAIHAHKPDQGTRVVACCDVNPKAFEGNRRCHGDDVFTTTAYQELLKQPLDAVFVTTPDFLHETHALAAIEAVPAVYIEKPMAITIDGCDNILRAAKRRGTRLFVGHNMRYMNIIRKMKRLIDDGAIGEVKAIWCRHFISYGGDAYFRDWHAQRRCSNGLLLQKGAHDIDVMHWLAGAYTKRVTAMGALSIYGGLPRRPQGTPGCAGFNETHWPPLQQRDFHPEIDVEDQSIVVMQLESGALATYMQCHFSPDAFRNYTVIGDHGRLENMGDGPDDPIFVWNRRKDHYRPVGDEVYRGDEVVGGGHGGADPAIVAEFIEFARNGIETTATPLAARMAVAAGCQATASLRDGGTPLDIPPVAQ